MTLEQKGIIATLLMSWKPIRRMKARHKALKECQESLNELEKGLQSLRGSVASLESLPSRVASLEGVRAQWDASLPVMLNLIDKLQIIEVEVQKLSAANSDEVQRLHILEAARDGWDASAASKPIFGEKFSQIDASIADLWQRMEVVRREALLEIRYNKNESKTASKIVDAGKLSQMRETGVILNLGCGHIPLEGYINIDGRDLPRVDIVAEIGDLPFEPNSVKTIFSAHLLEHFPEEELRRRLLPHWKNVLEQGGEFRAIVPDGDAMLNGVADKSYSFEDFRMALFGGQEYNGDFHYNCFTPESLGEILKAAGFVNVTCHDRGRRNGQCFEFEISARKP